MHAVNGNAAKTTNMAEQTEHGRSRIEEERSGEPRPEEGEGEANIGGGEPALEEVHQRSLKRKLELPLEESSERCRGKSRKEVNVVTAVGYTKKGETI